MQAPPIEEFLRETEECLRQQPLTTEERETVIALYEELNLIWQYQQQIEDLYD